MLDDQTHGAFGKYLFAISSVSGGSLGAVTYVAMLRGGYAKGETLPEMDWGKLKPSRLSQFEESDLLVASISTYFLNDTFRQLLRMLPFGTQARQLLPDRGVALERAFERAWADPEKLRIDENQISETGLIGLYQNSPRSMPHLLLNGTDVDSGRRIITSTIQFADDDDVFPNSEDLLTRVCKDIRASTAVTNSARFPYISPTGSFKDTNCKNIDGNVRHVVDGGYFENYGARTADDLARKIEELGHTLHRKVVPIVVVISNDAEGFANEEDRKSCADKNKQQLDDYCTNGTYKECKGDEKCGQAMCARDFLTQYCPLLGQVTISCDFNPERASDSAPTPAPSGDAKEDAATPRPRGGSFVGETLAPFLGLYATRGAHGQDALHVLRRNFCGTRETGVSRRDRMIHIALPAPVRENGESAPMNWVLNDAAITFLAEKAPRIRFNQDQACLLRKTLSSLIREDVRASQPNNDICGEDSKTAHSSSRAPSM